MSPVLLVGAPIQARVTHAHRHRTIELLLAWWVVANGILSGFVAYRRPASRDHARRGGAREGDPVGAREAGP
jgi:hypothetical protein